MQKYSTYKPSNVEWLGDVPSHWKVDRIKDIFIDNSTNVNIDALKKVERVAHYSIPAFDNGKKPEIVNGEEIDSNKTLLIGNQLLFSRLNSHKPRVWLIDEDDEFKVCSTEFFVHRNEDKKANLKFFEYLLTDDGFIALAASFQSSVTNSHKRIAPKDYYNFGMPLPPFTEQTAIAAYLDQATANIDKVIATKQKQLEKLEQYKQSKIHECVTKGLNPDVTLKPSGIDWIGEVPSHWKSKRFKDVFEMLDFRRIPLSSEERNRMEMRIYDYYGASGIIDKVEDYIFDEQTILIAEDGANLLSRSSRLVFIASGKYWVNNHAHVFKPRFGSLIYFAELLELNDFSPYVTGAAQPKLNYENLSRIRIVVPPTKEQFEIEEFLQGVVSKIEKEKSIIEQQIEKLKQYRKCLIHECVTGKRKVID